MVSGKAFSLFGGVFMVKRFASAVCVSAFMIAGCANVTEYELFYDARLNIYSEVNLALIDSLDLDPDARSILVRDNRIYVAGTDGYIRSYSTVTHSLLEENQVGAPAPSGYIEMEYNAFGNSIYLIGATGTIVDISVPNCIVTDQFSPCTSPVEIEITPGNPGYLWTVDGSENEIHQTHLATNGHCGSIAYPPHYQIGAISRSSYPDSLLVGTSGGFFRLETPSTGIFRSTWVKDVPWGCLALSDIPEDSNFIAILEMGLSTRIGELCVYDDSTYAVPPPKFYNDVSIPGMFFMMEPSAQGDYVYSLASVDGGGSILTTYRTGDDYGIETVVEMSGNPLDIYASEEGEVYVLIYE